VSPITLETLFQEFQFHCGAIKRFWRSELYILIELFQFHCGAIKSIDKFKTNSDCRDFNSIVVRLKDLSLEYIYLLESYFNSIVVRLKVTTPVTLKTRLILFQFHCGAIKRNAVLTWLHSLIYFNSIVVRLKHKIGSSRSLSSLVFQFHCGAIKRLQAKTLIIKETD